MRGFALLFVLLAVSVPAAAEQDAGAPADPRAFSLFNPVPDADLRPLCTDRPSKSSAPCTVDAGHLQIESDLFNVTVDRTGGATTDTYLITNPTLKLGILKTVDVEVNMVPFEIVTVTDHATGVRSQESGVGDLLLKLKWNLIGDDGGNFSIALFPYLKAPTAKVGIGNGSVEGGVIVPINFSLPAKWSLSINAELDSLKNILNDSHHFNTSSTVSLNKSVSDTVTLSGEIWTDTNFDPQSTTTQFSADLGIAWIPRRRPNLQLDGGLNVGLNNVTPGVQTYVGVSRRF
jgi:Putative MetA-pathway of phenol degradation